MLRFIKRIRFESTRFCLFHYRNLVLITAVALFLLLTQKMYADTFTVSGGKMVNLIWDTPESGVDHYRLKIIKKEMMSEYVVPSVSFAYTRNSSHEFELDEGSSYSVSIQSVNQYGVFSGFSEEILFAFNNNVITTTTVASDEKMPKAFSLFQNYPNPFNPMTTITYSIPNDSHIKLAVYNITGQKVTELQNTTAEAGTHSVVWDASDLPSGTYFYSIQTDGFLLSKKMLLLK